MEKESARDLLQRAIGMMGGEEPKQPKKRGGNEWTQHVSEWRAKNGGSIPAKGSDAYNAIKAKYDKRKKK